MSRIATVFSRLSERGEKALVTFITAGDPDLSTTARLIPKMAAAGADIIELGVPFSDPMADGPTIQKASERALAGGATLENILAMVKSVRSVTEVPILLMGYCNPIIAYGMERFAIDAVANGVDALLLVDLPPEEAAGFRKKALAAGLDLIFLLAPTSGKERISEVTRAGSGFIYYVSVTGVTGARESVAASVGPAVASIRAASKLPVVVGFGISTPEQAAQVASLADGVVVGSALVKLFEQYQGESLDNALTALVRDLKAGIRRAG
jgi:tryptophan synthase alpha chain